MKYAWIDGQRQAFDLSRMCAALAVSVSGYRAWKRGGLPHRKRLTDTQMLTLIRTIHAELKGAYGSPRMVVELRARGYPASKARVERLMGEQGSTPGTSGVTRSRPIPSMVCRWPRTCWPVLRDLPKGQFTQLGRSRPWGCGQIRAAMRQLTVVQLLTFLRLHP